MLSNERIQYLLQRYAAGKATEPEVQELFEQVRTEAPEGSSVQEVLQQMASRTAADPHFDTVYWENVFQLVLKQTHPEEPPALQPVHRTPLIRRTWFRWTAAAVLMLAAGMGVWMLDQRGNQPVTNTVQHTDVSAPVINRATVTLSDGRTVALDSLNSGLLAQQGPVQLVKLADGQIAYQRADSQAGGEMQYNTLFNPRGSKVIDLALSDGSHVWLNAGSSITYPVTFIKKDRKVSITGEAYFEVKHDARSRFYVTKGNVEVKVLGTHFNVNAYDDEAALRVTLLEGAVRLSRHHEPVSAVPGRAPHDIEEKTADAVTLRPGEQGVVPISIATKPVTGAGTSHQPAIAVMQEVDMEQVIAWKNGLFQFDNADIRTAMRQLERWYDLTVVYEGNVPDIRFGGELKRDLSLAQVLKGLGHIGVHFRIEGNKLVIMEK